MVLQLVLPQRTPQNDEESSSESINNNYVLTTSPEYLANKPKKRSSYTSYSQQESYIAPHYRSFGQGFLNRAFSLGDLSSTDLTVQNSTAVLEQNVGSSASDPIELGSTSPEEKTRIFRQYLTVILSCIYCVFIVTLGVVIYISDIIIGNSPIAETFSIYLIVVGFCYIVYLIVDIRLYSNKVKAKEERRYENDVHLRENVEFRESAYGDIHLSISLPPSLDPKINQPIKHYYCFSKGRHSGSFYLKIGAAGFCLGHLIHSGLLLGYQVVFLTSDSDFYDCASVATLVLDIIYPIYSFFQLFFIFKYSNVIINRCEELSRFAMMHCIASSLCFWLWTILRETMDSLTHHSYASDRQNRMAFMTARSPIVPESTFVGATPDDIPVALPRLTSYNQRGADDLLRLLNNTPKMYKTCSDKAGLDHIYENISPYLYPFSVEYSILVVGVLYVIWKNIGLCSRDTESQSGSTMSKECYPPPLTEQNGFSSNLVIHADCHSANRGLFAGIIILVSSLVSIILFFIAISDEEFKAHALVINSITELVLLVVMTIAAIIGYRQITYLDVNPRPVSFLDDLLLFICIPAFFLYAIFSIIPAVEEKNTIGILNIVLQIIQILVQTPFIIDGLRRCSNSRELRLKKPGRELVTFLVVCNVAMWITETFEIKSNDLQDSRYDFYGQVLWTIIGHLTVPLTMFYRFHSSVCLADIWKSAYESGKAH